MDTKLAELFGTYNILIKPEKREETLVCQTFECSSQWFLQALTLLVQAPKPCEVCSRLKICAATQTTPSATLSCADTQTDRFEQTCSSTMTDQALKPLVCAKGTNTEQRDKAKTCGQSTMTDKITMHTKSTVTKPWHKVGPKSESRKRTTSVQTELPRFREKELKSRQSCSKGSQSQTSPGNEKKTSPKADSKPVSRAEPIRKTDSKPVSRAEPIRKSESKPISRTEPMRKTDTKPVQRTEAIRSSDSNPKTKPESSVRSDPRLEPNSKTHATPNTVHEIPISNLNQNPVNNPKNSVEAVNAELSKLPSNVANLSIESYLCCSVKEIVYATPLRYIWGYVKMLQHFGSTLTGISEVARELLLRWTWHVQGLIEDFQNSPSVQSIRFDQCLVDWVRWIGGWSFMEAKASARAQFSKKNRFGDGAPRRRSLQDKDDRVLRTTAKENALVKSTPQNQNEPLRVTVTEGNRIPVIGSLKRDGSADNDADSNNNSKRWKHDRRDQ